MKDKLNFCKEEDCFEEKQEELEICATHYQKAGTELIRQLEND